MIRGLILTSGDSQYVNFELFSFSGLKGQTKISRNGLHINSNRVTLVISSFSEEFLEFLIDLIFKQKQIHIGQLIIEPNQVDREEELDLGNESKFICISPLVILPPVFNSDKGKRFIEPGTDEFSDLLYDSTIKRMSASGIETEAIEDIDKFQLIPDKEYIRKLRQSQKKFARIYPLYDQDVKYEVRGYTFPFELYAPREVQEFVFTCGLGNYCQKGFGMLDLANSNPTNRVVPREHSQKQAV